MHVMQCFTQFGNGGYEMKKIFIILCCMLCISAHATEMCARDDTVVIPLDATLNRKGQGANITEWIWWEEFDYGTIYGAAACLSLKEIQEIQNNPNLTSPPTVLNTSSDELIGSFGYYENNKTDPIYARIYCYYKITHPMSSSWAFRNTYSPPINSTQWACESVCYYNNGRYMSNTLEDKKSFFNSIGTVPPWEKD